MEDYNIDYIFFSYLHEVSTEIIVGGGFHAASDIHMGLSLQYLPNVQIVLREKCLYAAHWAEVMFQVQALLPLQYFARRHLSQHTYIAVMGINIIF